MTNLIEHALNELQCLALAQEHKDYIVRLAYVFLDIQADGYDTEATLDALTKIVRLQNLTELTTNELEWVKVSSDIWLNKRNSDVSSQMGHSESSAKIATQMLELLLRFENLSDLTNDPSEWELLDPAIVGASYKLWQNHRNSAVFSLDGGYTYYLVDEKDNSGKRKFYTTAEKKVSNLNGL